MKTAISIPDPIFEAAEETASRLGMSRSQLYAKAVEAFIEKLNRKRIKETLNEVYGSQDSKLDPVLAQMQFTSLPEEEW